MHALAAALLAVGPASIAAFAPAHIAQARLRRAAVSAYPGDWQPAPGTAAPFEQFSASEETLVVAPIAGISGVLDLPGSKSLSNRCLLLAALAEGTTSLTNLLDSEDIGHMKAALGQLGVVVDQVGPSAFDVTGAGGAFRGPEGETTEIFLGNAGTAMRPFAAVLAASKSGSFVLDGTARMRERPIGDLIDGLGQLGAVVECSDTACPPVRIDCNGANGVTAGKTCRISGQKSSQFITALLMAAPLAAGEGDVTIEITDELVSKPYVEMTMKLMARFGVETVANADLSKFVVKGGQKYVAPPGGKLLVEGDASSASYFLAGAAITGGPVTVTGCGTASLQGDVKFADELERMGATVEWTDDSITVSRDVAKTPLVGVDADCDAIPDAAMTLATAALFAQGPTTIRNVFTWRLKETERMKAIVAELRKLGATVEEYRDYCVITPPAGGAAGIAPGVTVDTYDDHRMAMAFSLAACGPVPVAIKDPKVTRKTFPTYFDVLEGMAVRG